MDSANPGHVPPHHHGYNFITASSWLFGLFGSLAERQTRGCGFLFPLRQQLQTVRMQLEISCCHASSGSYRYRKLSLGRHEEKFLFLQGKGQSFLPSFLSPSIPRFSDTCHSLCRAEGCGSTLIGSSGSNQHPTSATSFNQERLFYWSGARKVSSKFQQTWGLKLKINLASASLSTLVTASCAHAQDKSPVDKTPPQRTVGKWARPCAVIISLTS